jgi:uncharacterized protein
MSAPVVWFEVMGQDADKLQAFYGQLFQWEFTGMGADYAMVAKAAEGIPGGVGKAPQGPGHVTFYVAVPDINATLAEAEAQGGQILMPRTVMPEVTLALFADPEGHVVGIVEPNAES